MPDLGDTVSKLLRGDSARDLTILGLATPPNPIPQSRRLFITMSASAFALAAIGENYFIYNAPPSEPLPPITDIKNDPNVYTTGSVIETPAGRVRIEGWKILFDREDVSNKVKNNIIQFNILCDEGSKHGYLRGGPENQGKIELDDWIRKLGNLNPPTIDLDSRTHHYVNSMPHNDNQEMLLELAMYNPRRLDNQMRIVYIVNYRIQPKIFSYPKEDPGDGIRLVSEKDISTELLRPVHNIHRLFSEYSRRL